jgi:hypothetical protein
LAVYGEASSKVTAIVVESTLACTKCGHPKTERMLSDACQWFYECEACNEILRPI